MSGTSATPSYRVSANVVLRGSSACSGRRTSASCRVLLANASRSFHCANFSRNCRTSVKESLLLQLQHWSPHFRQLSSSSRQFQQLSPKHAPSQLKERRSYRGEGCDVKVSAVEHIRPYRVRSPMKVFMLCSGLFYTVYVCEKHMPLTHTRSHCRVSAHDTKAELLSRQVATTTEHLPDDSSLGVRRSFVLLPFLLKREGHWC